MLKNQLIRLAVLEIVVYRRMINDKRVCLKFGKCKSSLHIYLKVRDINITLLVLHIMI